MSLISKNKNYQNTTNTFDTTTTNNDNRVGGEGSYFGGNQSLVVGDGSTVSAVDFGAVSGGLALSGQALSEGFEFGRDGLNAALSVNSTAFELAQNVFTDSNEMVSNVLEQGGEQLKFFGEQTAQAFDRSLGFAKVANTSENAQFLESGLGLIKMGGLVVVAGIAAFIYFNKKN